MEIFLRFFILSIIICTLEIKKFKSVNITWMSLQISVFFYQEIYYKYFLYTLSSILLLAFVLLL